MPGRTLTPVTVALLVGVLACLLFAKPATTLPPDFTDSLVTDVPAPTALAFTPDGRMLVTSKSGQLWVYENGQKTQALDIDPQVCSNSERGLLGVAVDPGFGPTGNDYVYLYYTFNKHGACPEDKPARHDNPVNRVARYVLSDANVATFDQVLINNIPSPNGNHNGGDLKFGKDEYLYISIGDGGCHYAKPSRCQYENGASRKRHVLLGKVLRITRDGEIPPDNPYTGPDSARCNETGRTARGKNCQETFVWGFRNPFRIAFDPDAAATSFRINDVGGQRWEEIDQAQSGADYGWNLCEGRHDNPFRRGRVNCDGSRYTGPIHEYNHSTNCESITGGAFVPDDGSWPEAYDDSYLYSDFVCGKIFDLKPDGGGFSQSLFTDLNGRRPVAMAFGPPPAKDLYYTAFDFNGQDQVRRIAYTPGP